jgi:hypothetical protein
MKMHVFLADKVDPIRNGTLRHEAAAEANNMGLSL